MKKMKFLVLIFLLFPLVGKAQEPIGADVFFKGFDFADTSLVHSDVFQQKMSDFVYQFYKVDNTSEMDYIIALGPLFEKAKASMRVYEFVLDFMLNGFKNLEMSQVMDYLLNFPTIRENEIDAVQGQRLEAIAEPYQLVKVGEKAPDIVGVASNGESYRLYESKAQYVLLVFWATGCEHCHAFLRQLRRHAKMLDGFELLTFAIANDEEEWRTELKDNRLDGYHFFDAQRWSGDAISDYHVTTVPTCFVLDAEKTIVCKAYEWDELKDWMKNIK